MGQLGNQMFQLASAYGIAKARGSKVCTMGFAGTQLAESVELVLHLALERDALGARVDGGTVRRPSARAFFLDSVLINLSVLV